MPRMRTLKPEFWDSPSTAQASLAARLLFLAMWNWADDSGRGTAGLKELEAFAFPNDDIREYARNKAGNSGEVPRTTPELYRNFAEVCGDVAEAYGVVFYRVKSRPYYAIPSFRSHQAKDFRETSKYPLEAEGQFFDVTSGNTILPDGNSGDSAHEAGKSAPMAGKKNTVIGEKGNRVKELKDSSSEVADATPRPEVENILNLFDDRMVANGVKKPSRGKKNTDAVRLLIDKDGYTVDQIIWIINWATRHEFWRTNILSPAKLREKFDQLKLKSQSEATKNNVATTTDKMTQTMLLAQQMEHGQSEGGNAIESH